MSILTNLASVVDPNGVLAVAVSNPDSLRSSSQTAILSQGRRVPFQASINGQMFSAYATLRSASLHRVSLLNHTSTKKNTDSLLVTGMFKNVQMDIEVVIGNEILPLQEVLRQISNSSAVQSALNTARLQDPNATFTPEQIAEIQASPEAFASTLELLGLRFTTGMNIFWQQFGANQAGFDVLAEAFASAGAIDSTSVMKAKNDRIIKAFEMPQVSKGVFAQGPAVSTFEVGRAKRSESQTGQGFLDFVDATFDNYVRIVGLRKEADILKSTIPQRANAEGWSVERVEAEQTRATQLMRLSQQWASTWTGAQQRKSVDAKDPSVVTASEIFDPSSAPCGRFSLVLDGQVKDIDLWSNSTRANTSEGVAPVATVASAPVEAETTPLQWD